MSGRALLELCGCVVFSVIFGSCIRLQLVVCWEFQQMGREFDQIGCLFFNNVLKKMHRCSAVLLANHQCTIITIVVLAEKLYH